MATERVRVVTYVDEELATLLSETAAALGKTRSALLGEVLANSVPVLRVMRDMAVTLREAPARQRAALDDVAGAAGSGRRGYGGMARGGAAR